VLILPIACVNFMNSAPPARRRSQVGIRKGSAHKRTPHHPVPHRIHPAQPLLFVLPCIAVLLLPMFNQLAGKSLHPDVLFSGRFLPILILLVLLSAVSPAATQHSTFPPFSRSMY
jgi:putative ABC transport system permease protein